MGETRGVLYKLRRYVPKQTILSVYYSIFYSHITYACQVWALTSLHNINIIKVLKKKCMRIINFAPFNSHTYNLFESDKILKFEDVIKFEQLEIIYEFKSNSFPKDLSNLFIENTDINYHFMRNVANEGIYIPQIQTKSFGTNSLKYSAAILWNNHLKNDVKINTFTSL